MKSKIGWILAIALGLIILFFLPSLWMGHFWMGGYGGMMQGPGMMGGFGHMNPLGFFGMALMWLIPVGILVLLVVGGVVLVNSLNRPVNAAPTTSNRKCADCGKAVQSDWTTCPYCGKSLQ